MLMNIRPRTVLAFLALLAVIYFFVKIVSVFWLIIIFNIVLLYINNVFIFAYLEFKGKEKPVPVKWPFVSIVIPNYNGAKTIAQCVNSCIEMEYRGKKEIIVVDDGSTDSSKDELQKIKGIKIIFKKKNAGKAAALNDGIKIAKGEYVAAIDSDTFPTKIALVKMIPKFGDNVAAVTGLVRAYKPTTFIEKIQEVEYLISFGFFQTVLAEINGILVTPGPMSVFKRSVLLEIGGLDEKNITEDMEIALRLQKHRYKIAAAPEAVIYTDVPKKISHLIRQRTRWYRGKFVNTRKYFEMVLNPKYGEFGMFSFPFSLVADALAILMIFITIAANIEGVFQYLGFVVSWLALNAGISGLVPAAPVLHSSIYFYVFTIIMYSILVYLSHKFVNDNISIWKMPEIIFYLFVYGFFISFVYFISFFKEINSSDYIW